MTSKKKIPVRWTVGIGVVMCIILVLGVLWAMQAQQTQLADPLVVSVNGDAIYTSEVLAWQERIPQEERQRYTPQVLIEQLIDQRLILQYAREQGVEISDEQLQKAVDRQLSFFGTTHEELSQALKAQGESFEEFERGVHDELVFEVFISEVLLPSIDISDSRVQAYYEDNPSEFQAPPSHVRIRHLLVSSEEDAQGLRDEWASGVEFATLARAYSLDNAPRGGDLGFISEDSPLVEPFKTAALALDVEEVSEPVQTEFGWHLIKREPDVIPLREARQIISNKLQQAQAQEVFSELLQELRGQATIRYYRGADAFLED